MKNKISDEFKFIAERLKAASTYLSQGSYVETAWMMGCLHEICIQNAKESEETLKVNI